MTDAPTGTNPTDSPAATPRPLVVLDKVNKHFGTLHVLKDIDLTINVGEVVVVIGPSGSGKSTLCRTINRLDTFESAPSPSTGSFCPARPRPWHGCVPTSGWSSSRSTCLHTRRFSLSLIHISEP